MTSPIIYIAIVCALLTLLTIIACINCYYASVFNPEKEDKLSELSDIINRNINNYILSQLKIEIIFFIAIFAVFAFMGFYFKIQSPWTAISFAFGGFLSVISGYISFKTSANAIFKSIEQINHSVSQSFNTLFKSASISVLLSGSFALLDIMLCYAVLKYTLDGKIELFKETLAINSSTELSAILLSFAVGASLHALFTRFFGGIFSKGSELGVELATKIEAGIPENDTKNPATVVKMLGETSNSVFGLSSDFYSLLAISVLASIALGSSAFNDVNSASVAKDTQLHAMALPILLAAIGIFTTMLMNIFLIKIQKEDITSKELISKINNGSRLSAIILSVLATIAIMFMLQDYIYLLGSIVTGIMAGIIINWTTEYYTSVEYEPAKEAASQTASGPASVIMQGLEEGMQSTCIPLVTTAIAMILAYAFSEGFTNSDMGLYGVSIAAVAMVSTLGVTLSASAYGSNVNNIAYCAKISVIPQETASKTEFMTEYSNTAVSIGKGVLAGATSFASFALLAAIVTCVKSSLMNEADLVMAGNENNYIYTALDRAIPIKFATADEIMAYFGVQPMNPYVISGVLLGLMAILVICAASMRSISKTAYILAEEVRKQFKEVAGLLQGEEQAKPDYNSSIQTTCVSVQREILTPILISLIVPLGIGLFMGIAGVVGFVMGIGTGGFAISLLLSTTGGVWNGAKQYIESGQFGGKSSDNHKSTVIADMVGNPLKDACATNFHSVLLFVAVYIVATVGIYVNYTPYIQKSLGLSHSDIAFKESYKSLVKANKAEYPSLERKKTILSADNENFGFEDDPLMGTEDIILPKNDPTKNSLVEPYKPEYIPGSVKPIYPEEKEEEKTEKQKNSSTSSSESFSGGFGDGGFDTFDETAKDTNTDSSKPEAKQEEKKEASNAGFDGGFDSGFDAFEETPANNETSKADQSTAKEANEPTKEALATVETPETPKAEESVKSAETSNMAEKAKSEDSVKPNETTKQDDSAKATEDSATETPAPAKEEPKAEESDPFAGGFDGF